MKTRCEWAGTGNRLMVAYHDKEWGRPVKNDRKLFEFLILEGAQAGLSWQTILNRRENYRRIFKEFDYQKLAKLTDQQLEKILKDPGIIRNRLKVYSVRINARAFLQVRKEFGTFSRYCWSFAGGQPIRNKWKKLSEIPATTPESDALSKDLKKRGFKFAGSTICYAFMQAVGMVNDHTVDCFRYKG
ncbi:MAG: DNA-3-methyladenine glycosylase I [Nitrospinaceae bacterium]|nr:DNA-3-methyladenine glycosylase I [Nitrospinaceae bacterium]NIR57496.1 DNA-3-methyladenine glycosylase I [Nitrospinaceae bacterium]NIS87966.1 DNA-3-methyladenine glycosylase I [Nitrospinaceae bacterium]NIT84831.1 DNA-3-methyladenine glycosylase I [Nitrospinaceae bacterium]NIU47011.1 DNA-3-methyladenine glycosylase I [Nitrospinaceae bacterium]